MRYLYLVLGLCTGLSLFGQDNSTTFFLPDVSANNGAEVCLPITAINFSNGVEFSFAIQTVPPANGGALTFSRVIIPGNVPNLDLADFNLTEYVAAGVITVQWGNYANAGEDCTDADGDVTLDDDEVLFEVCYDVSGPVASNHPVRFFNLPDDTTTPEDESVPIDFRKTSQCGLPNGAFPGNENGSVTIGVQPVRLTIFEEEGIFQPGDVFCTDVVAESGFTDLTGLQFGIQFDSTVLKTISATTNPDITNVINFGSNLFDGNSFFGQWADFFNTPRSLNDGTPLLTLCFEVVGECSDRTDLEVGDILVREPDGDLFDSPVEAVGSGGELATLPIVTEGTELVIDDCNPLGFDVIVNCPDGEVNFGDTEVCVQFQAGDDFDRMVAIDYLINWDASILEFVRVEQTHPSMDINTVNAASGDFDYDRTDDGILAFDWSAAGSSFVNLPEGTTTFAVCFNVIGFGGTSPITISDFRNDIESTDGFFNGLNPTNCAITVNQPEGVAVKFPDIGFSSTQDICFDLEVDGFQGVTDFTLYVSLTNVLFDYRSFAAAIPGASALEISPGLLQISYSGPPLDIPNGGSLGSLCYRAQDDEDAAPGECATIEIADFIPSSVITTESGGNSVSVDRSFSGEACVLFPNGFGLIVGDAAGFVNQEVCVPVSVTRFTDVTQVATTFTFDPEVLSFNSVDLSGNWPGLSNADFDVSGAALGQISLNYSTPNPAGTNIVNTDTSLVFTLCFTASGQDGCSDVAAENSSDPATVTAAGPGSIVYRDGEVCVNDRLEITSLTVIPASCDDSDDGGIMYTTAPRPGNEDVFIRTDNPLRFGNNGFVSGLLPGQTNFTLYTSGGALTLDSSIVITVDPSNAAVANAGDDKQLTCGDNPVANIDARDNEGETFALFLVTPSGNTVRVADGDVGSDGSVFEQVNDPGDYILIITSAAGCTARDTVTVLPADNPVADANQDSETALTCNGSGVTLRCTGSSTQEATGIVTTYLWERITTEGAVLFEVGSGCEVTVTDPGRYRLTVSYPSLGCSATDVVIVRDEADVPSSQLPAETQLNCDGSAVTLTTGPVEDNVTYRWTVLGETEVLSTTNTLTTGQLGTYEVTLTNTVSGCTLVQAVTVTENQGAPAVTSLAETSMACNPDTLLLGSNLIIYGNVSDGTQYRWSTEDGRVLLSDFTLPFPRVVEPGTYRVTVRNGTCIDSAQIVVTDPVLPIVEAGEAGELTCAEGLQLTGTGNVTTGNEIAFQWFRGEAEVPMGAAAAIIVDQPGTYYLEVTDVATGCVGRDSVVVDPPTGFPTFTLVDTVNTLGCDGDMVTLTVEDGGTDDYEYVWTDPAGMTIGTSASVMTGVVGVHYVEVTNLVTSCTAVDSVLVLDDAAEVPFVSFRQNTIDITCETGPALIDASPSTQGENITFFWEVVSGGETPMTQGNDSLLVRVAGVYRLTVTNTETNCSRSREVEVTDSRVLPNVEAVPGQTLDCETRSTVIGIDILDQPNDYDIQWAGPGGIMGLPQDTNRITVTDGGTYNAVVIDPITSCVTIVQIPVVDLIDSLSTISIAPVDSFDCTVSTRTIDASGTDLVDAETITWTSLNGNTVSPATGSLIVVVDGAGDYELAITSSSGCTIRDTVTVVAATDTPFAQAGEDIMVECGEMPQLDGSNSTPAPGSGVLYEWSVVGSEGIILSGANGTMPLVDGPGTYRLVITNTGNGCADSSQVTVALSDQVAADAGTDFTTCDSTVTVTGNLPAGSTGEWTAFNDENSVWSADGATATVTSLGDGLALVWTLSGGLGCENYSADTVRISPEEAPVANNDGLEVGGDQTIGTVDLKNNDQRTGPVTVTLLTEPEFGTVLSNLNGEVTFEAPRGLTGTTSIEYEICSSVCPNLCDRAVLTIRSSADGADPEVFNAISPNGDGMNDRFIFDILELRADEFPDNELIIFNRWGDILYEAAPYNNDWTGTTNGGQDVPEGTYYYILRLNVGAGEIIRGDVTVIR